MKKNSYIQALEAERAGDWDKAHHIVQDIHSEEAAWVHAYLHRVEGDPGNAAYWYRRAGRAECNTSLAEEWQALFDALSE
ncbi:hypothetical protein P4E94_16310 [Pontiellaceae bacterium B12219]|nr:hypothetical protein [Pontiellaceae bacterium B12219]